ncbi:MAG: host specificity factor TipJ family phage tail protein [Mizugakiibacter sp.]|uniref:host specificity factor TipJ family phage tail protein n=1 Tax=Mizugakiibacter sp. TaxID=1972610 RepID=UPI00320D36DC
MADGTVDIVARPHPFSPEVVYCEARAGQTIAQIVGENAARALRVEVDGYEVPRELWTRVRPKAGRRVQITAFPEGGGNNNKLLKIVVVIVAIVYAYYTSDYRGALKIIAYGWTLTNLLVPPPLPKGGGGGDPFNALTAITGTSNQVNLYGAVPLVIGEARFYPPHAALPYTEILGDQQYLRMLLDLGPGDLDITPSDIKIGETPLTSFDEVEYQISTAPTLFTQDVFELSVGTVLADGNSDTRTTQTGTEEISLDLLAQAGFFAFDKKNHAVGVSADFTVQYRAVGNTTWLNAASASGLSIANGSVMIVGGTTVRISSAKREPLRTGIRWKVTAGQYEVKVTRVSTNWGSSVAESRVGDFVWTVLRSIAHQSPSNTGTNKLAVRIRATDQLQGVISTLSVVARQKISTYDKATQTWTTGVPTSNCAWVAYWLLTACPSLAKKVPASRVDLDAFADWAAECTAKGFVFKMCLDSTITLFDLVRDVMAAGRASFNMREGLYSVVRDVQQTVPVQIFTPANSKGFSGSRQFRETPHALRVQFTNPQANWQQDERIVLDDGYQIDGKDAFGNAAPSLPAATKFEVLDLRKVTDADAAWRLGRYHLAASRLRPNTYSFETDIENLICDRGDLIRRTDDVPEWGLAYGRVKTVTLDVSNNVQSVTTDEALTFEVGKTYAAQFRKNDGTVVSTAITGSGTDVHTFDLTTHLPSVQPGDLFVLGETGNVTADLIVIRKEALDDLGARITCVDAAPAVWTADSGTPPAFVSTINGQVFCEPPALPDPSTVIFVSDQRGSGSDDGGVTRPTTRINLPPGSGIYRNPLTLNRRMLVR